MVIGLGVESRPMGSIVRRGRNWSDTGGILFLILVHLRLMKEKREKGIGRLLTINN